MLSLKASTLALCVIASAGIGAAGSAVVMTMTSSATASASLTCQPTARPAETFRHADPVNTGRNKEY